MTKIFKTCLNLSVALLFIGTFSDDVQAHDSKGPPSGFAISVGKLSPIGLGIIDEQHVDVGTRIGYRVGRVQAFLVLDYANISGELTDSYIDYDYETDREITVKSKDSFSGSMFTVGAGLKYLLNAPKSGQVQSYLVGSAYTFIPSIEIDGEEVDEELENSSAFGLTAGFGAQYAFSHHFSAGLELGVSYTSASIVNKNDDEAGASLTQLYNMLFLEFVL
jgi:hypothetical protein